MPRGVKKENLPSKICVSCNRPFTWRKKWEKVWDEVSTCSKSCNKERRERVRKDKMAISEDILCHERSQPTNECVQNESESSSERELKNAFAELRTDMTESEVLSQQLHEENATNANGRDVSLVAYANGHDHDEESSSEKKAISEEDDLVAQKKSQRKANKKAKKAERRAQRAGNGDPTAGQKSCDMCGNSVDLLVRCMFEESPTEWKMVCGQKCWKIVSGGVADGDAAHPLYRYGGLWKNRRAQS